MYRQRKSHSRRPAQRIKRTQRTRRTLISELLEPRLLLANDLPFQNQAQPFDVNRDLRVSGLDALQVLNFIGQNGVNFQLPETNDGKESDDDIIRFPDVNGSGGVSSLDALLIINRLPTTLPPVLATRLASDSAPGSDQNLDFITNSYGLQFAVTNSRGGEQLEIRINGTESDPFVTAGALTGETEVLIDESQLNTIAGSPLGDGLHQFDVRIAGDDTTQSFVVTVDKTTPAPPSELSLTSQTDSGLSAGDGITNVETPDVTGDAETGSLVTLLIDGEVVGQATASSPWQASAGTLSEGTYTATATTEDIAGNPSSVSDPFQFEIDLTAPTAPAFDLDLGSDTAPQGDQATHQQRVDLVGQTTADVLVQVLESGQSGTSDGGGNFQLTGITLGLGANLRTVRATDAAGNSQQSQQTFTLANQAPSFDSVGPLQVMPGHRLEVPLSASDADGDDVTFSIDFDGQLPSGSIANDVLMFEPVASDIGTYQFTLAARDSFESTPQPVTLEVVEDPISSTRVSGQILDVDSEALVGVRVSIGDVEDFTDADGNFELSFGRNALPSDALRVHADELLGPNTYPFIAEKLPLLYDGRDVIPGINNVMNRPIYLPALDMDNAVTIDPAEDITVTTTAIPDVELFVAAGTLLDQQGDLFTGELSITEVPPDFTPAALPEGWVPGTLVTIQPGDMVFTEPAPLNLPNREGWAPGRILDLYSINPVTGEFDDVGDMQVSVDGQRIETISGGVRNSSWHGGAPPPPPDEPDDDSPD